jgi:hypothetical protein
MAMVRLVIVRLCRTNSSTHHPSYLAHELDYERSSSNDCSSALDTALIAFIPGALERAQSRIHETSPHIYNTANDIDSAANLIPLQDWMLVNVLLDWLEGMGFSDQVMTSIYSALVDQMSGNVRFWY